MEREIRWGAEREIGWGGWWIGVKTHRFLGSPIVCGIQGGWGRLFFTRPLSYLVRFKI